MEPPEPATCALLLGGSGIRDVEEGAIEPKAPNRFGFWGFRALGL